MPDIRSDPAYAEGFEDATDFTPLFDDASEAYRAGWYAAHKCKGLLASYEFKEVERGHFAKNMTIKK